MAGHSQFKNIMYRKGAQDARRSKIFARLTRDIVQAVRHGGSDPDGNSKLRLAIQSARARNMPNDNIHRAIHKAEGVSDGDYEQARYEGYAQGKVAIVVEAITDNRNRSAGAVRSTFSRHGGTLAEPNAVTYLFSQRGEVVYPLEGHDGAKLFDVAVEAGATDVESEEEHRIDCDFSDLGGLTRALEEAFGPAESSRVVWTPHAQVTLEPEQEEKARRLIRALEEVDDVEDVFSNLVPLASHRAPHPPS